MANQLSHAVWACSPNHPDVAVFVSNDIEALIECAEELNAMDADHDYRIDTITPDQEYAYVMRKIEESNFVAPF